jgi:outer membrane protein OmpA-like peptidoglycan-associated protein
MQLFTKFAGDFEIEYLVPLTKYVRKDITMNNKLLVLLLFMGWSFFSWRWYVCRIKGVCPGKEMQLTAAIPSAVPLISEATKAADAAANTVQSTADAAFTDGTSSAAAKPEAPATAAPATKPVPATTPKPDPKGSTKAAAEMAEGGDAPAATNAGSGAAEDHVSIEETADEAIIHFPYNSTRKVDNDEMGAYLTKLAKRLNGSGEKVLITGHTDGIGDAATNSDLALKRAQSIRAILIKKGVKANAITCRSFGERKPVASDDTPAGRYRNRRAVITVQ